MMIFNSFVTSVRIHIRRVIMHVYEKESKALYFGLHCYKHGKHCNKMSLNVLRSASSWQNTLVVDPSNWMRLSSLGCAE